MANVSSPATFSSLLLVEDDPGHVALIKRAIKHLVGEIHHCPDVRSACEWLGRQAPDVIITDLGLPDTTDGRHVAEFTKLAPDTPLVVLTSSTSVHEAVRAMQSGALDYVVKDENLRDTFPLVLMRLFAAQEVKRDRLRLEREERGLRSAIDSSDDGLAVLAFDGTITYANRRMRSFIEQTGGTSDQFGSVFTSQLQRAEVLLKDFERTLSELDQAGVWQTEITFKDNAEEAFGLTVSRVTEVGVPRFVAWLRDMSEIRRRERFQREILSTTTHDLKGPLSSVVLSAELLQNMLPNNERPFEIVGRMASAAQGAINLVDEFLSARRLQEGTFILRPTEQPIALLLEETLGNYSAIAGARKIDLLMQVKDQAISALVDRLGFIRVIGNLVSNAIKFTPEGGKVEVSAFKQNSDLVVQVCDNGRGIEPDEVQVIFQRFGRLDRHSGVAGTGLGLYVVKSIVTAHGGNVAVRSAPGKGTTFELTFPEKPPVTERGELISLDFS